MEDDTDFVDYADEEKGFLESVGENPPDPNSVAFLLPLRGLVGDLGMRLVPVRIWFLAALGDSHL